MTRPPCGAVAGGARSSGEQDPTARASGDGSSRRDAPAGRGRAGRGWTGWGGAGRRARVALLLAAHLLAPVAPAAVVSALAVPARPAAAQQAIGAPRGTITVGVGEGRLLRLDRDASNVFVANSAVADVQVASARLLYVYGRRVGQTTLTAVGAGDAVAGSIMIRVERNAEPLAGALTNRSAATLGFAGDRLVVRGAVADVGEAMEVENTARAYNPTGLPPLDRTRLAGTQQITLRVRIAEVSRNDLNRLGVNLSVLANPGSFTVGLLGNAFAAGVIGATGGVGGVGSALSNLGSGAGTSLFGSENAFTGGFASRGSVNADALINALQRENVVTLLAEPNLTTLSGETASFLAGGEVPIPVPQSFGVTTIQYRQFGVALAFTPTLLPGNRIAMRVRPEVSQIDDSRNFTFNGYTVPAFQTRRAETNVELASGQTLAIAGLFQRSLSDGLDRVPFLGDVPVLGALFRSQRFQKAETELMILVTPLLSVPTSAPGAIALPTDDLNSRPRPLARAGFVVD